MASSHSEGQDGLVCNTSCAEAECTADPNWYWRPENYSRHPFECCNRTAMLPGTPAAPAPAPPPATRRQASIVCAGGSGSAPLNSKVSSCPVAGTEGTECSYQCNAGFLKVGRHVCQSYAPGGTFETHAKRRRVDEHSSAPPRSPPVPFINQSYFGGSCMPLCPASSAPCPSGSVPVRVNATLAPASAAVTASGGAPSGKPDSAASAGGGWCLQTVCRTADDAIANLTRGAYEVFRLGACLFPHRL